MDTGYIKLYRCLKDNPIIQKPDYLAVWIHLLLSVNYQDKDLIFNGEKITIKSGSYISSRQQIALNTKVQESKVERILKYLESEHQIEQQSFNKFRIISICNWKQYQQNEQHAEQQMNNKRTTSEQQVNTNKKEKKEKNIKNNIYTIEFLSFYNAYPNKKEKNAAFNVWQKINKPDLETVLNAIEKQIEWRENAPDGEFRPEWKHPATWLNKGCWDDVIEEQEGNIAAWTRKKQAELEAQKNATT
jgi:hypothetical protein